MAAGALVSGIMGGCRAMIQVVVVVVALVRIVQSSSDTCDSLPELAKCESPENPSCGSDVVLALLPDENGNWCSKIFSMFPPINFPGWNQLHAAVKFLGPSLFNDVIKNVEGTKAKDHDPLCASLLTRDELNYCVFTLDKMAEKLQFFGSMTSSIPSSLSGCVAVQPGFRTVSLSLGSDGFGVSTSFGSVKLLGMMISEQACTKVAMHPFLVLNEKEPMKVNDGQEGMTSHAGIKMTVKLNVDLEGKVKLSLSTTAAAYMNLDLENDGVFVSPTDVVQALMQSSCLRDSKKTDWALLMQSEVEMSLSLGDGWLSFRTAPGNMKRRQVYAFQTNKRVLFSVAFQFEGVDTMSNIFEQWEKFKEWGLTDFVCKALDGLGVSTTENAFCQTFAGFGSENANFFFTASSQSSSSTAASDVGVMGQIRGISLGIRKNSEGWQFCLGEICASGLCIYDGDCGPVEGVQRQCARTRGNFKCEPVYGACCKPDGECRSETWAYSQCLGDSNSYDGYHIDWLSAKNAVKCKQITDSNPWHCIPKPPKPAASSHKWGACCSTSSEWKKDNCRTASWEESECKPEGGEKIFWLSASAKYCKTHPEGAESEKTLHCIKKEEATGVCNDALMDVPTFQPSTGQALSANSDPGSSSTFANPGEDQCPGDEDTGGRCETASATSCESWRGAVDCVDGKCLCKQGFCLIGGDRCENPYLNDTKTEPQRSVISMAHGLDVMMLLSTVLILQRIAGNFGHFSS